MAKNKNTNKSNRLNQRDILEKDKLEVSSVFIYRPEYRELSSNAKYMYQYLIKRFSVTIHNYEEALKNDELEKFTFIDEEGDLFCYVSNDELRFVLDISEKTVTNAKKELHAVHLLEEEKQANNLNRLYVIKATLEPGEKKKFDQDLAKFREVEGKKRKEKNAKRSEKKTKTKSEPQILQFPENTEENEVNRKNNGSVNRKKYSSVNRKIYGQSTKESLSSTKESKSTKEIYLSSLNEIDAIKMPTKLVIKKNIDRMIQDNISLEDLILFYGSKDNKLEDQDFNNVLDNVLQFTKSKIKNIKSVLKTAIKNYISEIQEEQHNSESVEDTPKQPMRKPIRVEQKPEFMEEDYVASVDEIDNWEEVQRKLKEDLLQLSADLKSGGAS